MASSHVGAVVLSAEFPRTAHALCRCASGPLAKRLDVAGAFLNLGDRHGDEKEKSNSGLIDVLGCNRCGHHVLTKQYPGVWKVHVVAERLSGGAHHSVVLGRDRGRADGGQPGYHQHHRAHQLGCHRQHGYGIRLRTNATSRLSIGCVGFLRSLVRPLHAATRVMFSVPL